MNWSGVLTIRDYLNYYVAGVAWLLLASAILLPEQLSSATAIESALGIAQTAILVLVLPYVAGFLFGRLGALSTRLVRWASGDPIWLAIDPRDSDRGHWRLARMSYKRVGETAIQLAAKNAKTFIGSPAKGSDREYLREQFYLIRTYVTNSGLPSAALATRDQLLANLAESLLLPVPVTFLVLAIRFSFSTYGPFTALPGVLIDLLLICAAFGAALLLLQQYLYLREYHAKNLIWTLASSGAAVTKQGASRFSPSKSSKLRSDRP
jgi:hypothetical protein